jgi:hypothetical protein
MDSLKEYHSSPPQSFDDVLGIICLAIVLGIVAVQTGRQRV